MSSGARLRAVYPSALECSTGGRDPALLPVDAIKSALNLVGPSLTARDLQYAGPGATERLGTRLIPLLEADLVGARIQDLIIANSAQQFLMLALELVSNSRSGQPTIGVEEPGYPTSFDTYERCGARLIGIQVDNFGAVPASLLSALEGGVGAVLLTPRGHNPMGASWSRDRRIELADVLASFPDVMIAEDDHFAGMATTRPGSLITDARLENRVLYVRSFSKSLAPDLRIAVGVARPALHEALAHAKSFSDGWTSRLLQGLSGGDAWPRRGSRCPGACSHRVRGEASSRCEGSKPDPPSLRCRYLVRPRWAQFMGEVAAWHGCQRCSSAECGGSRSCRRR